jgi:hypothetical protein
VHILQLFDCLRLSINIEVIVTPLPELSSSGTLQFAGCFLLQNLLGNGQRRDARLIGEQVNVLRHQDISSDDKTVPLSNQFKFALEHAVGRVVVQQGQSLITTEGNEMKLAGLVIADQVSEHGEGSLAQGLAFVPTHPSQKDSKDGAPSSVVGGEFKRRMGHPSGPVTGCPRD